MPTKPPSVEYLLVGSQYQDVLDCAKWLVDRYGGTVTTAAAALARTSTLWPKKVEVQVAPPVASILLKAKNYRDVLIAAAIRAPRHGGSSTAAFVELARNSPLYTQWRLTSPSSPSPPAAFPPGPRARRP